MNTLSLYWQIWRAGRSEPQALAAMQQQRLGPLVAFARAYSPFYEAHYRQIPQAGWTLQALPPVSKPQLMARFDQWVTDARVTREGVEAFVADPALVGQPYLGRYAVYTTSGTTGTPGLFLHDPQSLTVNMGLWQLRGQLPYLGLKGGLVDIFRRDFCEVFVIATGGHFGGAANAARLRRQFPWMAERIVTLSVLLPLAELVEQLNQVQPSILAIYPTALLLLSTEQKRGRLKIHPQVIICTGEWLAPAIGDEAAAVFRCPVRNIYGCSEFAYVALGCEAGWLHLNADWLIMEPVDGDYQPVPAGETSHSVLITSLVNHIQPLIRYELGDSVTLRDGPCPCGNPLPALRVEGRRDAILSFSTGDGAAVELLPMALSSVVETTPGVHRYQLIQTGAAELCLRLEATPGADDQALQERVVARLQEFLATQGLANVTLRRAAEPPQRDPRSGKYRQIWQEWER